MEGILITPIAAARPESPADDDRRPEYVRTAELAREIRVWLDADETRNYHALAEAAGVSPRAVSKVLNIERPYQTVFLADRLMTAMDRGVEELHIVRRSRRRS